MKNLYSHLFLFLLPFFGFGQGQNNYWYFGGNAGVNFASGASTITPTVMTNGVSQCDTGAGVSSTGGEGCAATVSKADGSLLFYTDGHKIFNKNHQLMSGSPIHLYPWSSYATKQVVIVPHPGNTNIYYVLIADAPVSMGNPAQDYGFYRSIVDFTTNPLGQVTSFTQPFTSFYSGWQAITATKNLTGDAYYVIVTAGPSSPTNQLVVYKVDNTGLISTPFMSNTLNFDMSLYTELKVSQQTTNAKIAIAGGEHSGNPAQTRVFTFDRSTGQIGSTPLLSISNIKVISTEFSADGNLLYAMIYTPTLGYRLVVYDINNPSTPYRLLSNNTVMGCLQRATNGEIYFTNLRGTNTDASLYKIDNQNSFSTSAISTNVVSLGAPARFGLPQLVQTLGELACSSLVLESEPNTGTIVYNERSDITAKTNYNVTTQNVSMFARDYILFQPNVYINTKENGQLYVKPQACGSTGRMASADSEIREFGVEDLEVSADDFRIFPNPSNAQVTLSGESGMKAVSITSQQGFVMFNASADNQKSLEVDISSWPAGIYFVKATMANGKILAQKLVKK